MEGALGPLLTSPPLPPESSPSYSSIPSPELDSCLISSSTSPSRASSVVVGGSSGREVSPRCLHLGEGDLHPFASPRAAFLGQAFACAKWGPLQFAHLVTVCQHQWPFLTLHPSTGHQRTVVACSSAHPPHLAVVRVHFELIRPQLLQWSHLTSGLVSS